MTLIICYGFLKSKSNFCYKICVFNTVDFEKILFYYLLGMRTGISSQ